ncbi:mechanosensitive ion channel family protein [Acuticoccus sediminis]|uniref:mechanosensitive ion channel family protein n=1 Tax=Acuticoccus sediminis TaxID=2184697 RepID=UPI001CFCA5FD|nr:mechanosensitive ion channel family protein [Acuticoccus sediminis]
MAAWLHEAQAAGAPEAAQPAPAESEEQRVASDIARHVDHAREHLRAMAVAAPRVPVEAARAADEFRRERAQYPPGSTLALFLLSLGLGAGAELLLRRALLGRRRVPAGAAGPGGAERVDGSGVRLMVSLLSVAVFAAASIGPFLAIEWPPLLKELALNVLLAIVLTRLALAVLRALFASAQDNAAGAGDRDPRSAARNAIGFWQRYTTAFVVYLVWGSVLTRIMLFFEFSTDVRQLAADALALGLLAIALAAVWRRPPRRSEALAPPWRRPVVGVLLTIFVLVVWLLWVAGMRGAFWLALLAVVLPRAIAFAHATISRLLTPPDAAAPPTARRALLEVTVDRGVRALLIVAAAFWLAHVGGVDIARMTSVETPLSRLMSGVLTSVVVLLVADFVWQLVKTGLNAELSAASIAQPGTAAAIRDARMRTLIPIFRNVVFIVIFVFAALMALAALGVQIGPLIAGAGVVGVAVGFGAQNLVKDIIAGMFYLVDDAFRVGEYIQSGSYKGTVEGFSLRSIRLRHQNGPIFVIPFSELGAVENMSRDWVIEKFNISVTYDSDIERAKKLVRQIGQELLNEPEFAQNILETLKMQGVDRLGDYAVELRCKMKTRPGEQFVIRRKALAMIKKAFDENGIRFAFPTVQVAGGGEAGPAVAQQALELVKPAVAS